MHPRHSRSRLSLTPTTLLALFALTAGASAQEPTVPVDISDDAIEVAIRADFRHDGAIPEHRIDVKSIDGVVRLSGTVDDLLARRRAEELCERIRGVRAVVDSIEVEPVFDQSDEEVERAVRAALRRDPATEAYEIRCEVTDGEARVVGTVDSQSERLLTLDVVRGVQGVVAIDDRIDVRAGDVRSPGEIQSDVEGRLAMAVWVDAGPIDVAVDPNGNVTLTGKVGSAYEKRLAARLAWVDGVRSVDDSGLEVSWHARGWLERARPEESASDSAIRDAVKVALASEPRLTGGPLRVEVDEGTVTLDGVVADALARIAAERAARSVVGVQRVRNYVRVQPTPDFTDSEIERSVETSLRETTAVDADEVEVEVEHGSVFLTGAVDSDWERIRAGDAARTADGVVDVSNLLLVEHPRATYAEGELADECERRMEWSPYLDPAAIDVDVSASTLILSGTVPTWRERLEAARCARLAGAEHVVNRIRVDDDDT